MRRLLTVTIGGTQYPVYEVPAGHKDLVKGAVGTIVFGDDPKIFVAKGPADQQIDTILHEIIHGSIEVLGLSEIIQAAVPLGGVTEEIIVSRLTPTLRAALQSAGWAEPKLPVVRKRSK